MNKSFHDILRSLAMFILLVQVFLLGACLPPPPPPAGLSSGERDMWRALHGSEGRVTIADVELRELPSDVRVINPGPWRANPDGGVLISSGRNGREQFNAGIRGYWETDIEADERSGTPARKQFTGVSVGANWRVGTKQLYPHAPPPEKPFLKMTDEERDIYKRIRGDYARAAKVYLDCNSSSAMACFCVTREGKQFRTVADNWYLIVAIVGNRGIICWNTPGFERIIQPYRRAFRRFEIRRKYFIRAREVNRQCIREIRPCRSDNGGPANPPMETATKADLEQTVSSAVLIAMKGKRGVLKLGGMTIREAPRRVQFISERSSEPGIVSLFPLRASKFPYPTYIKLPEIDKAIERPDGSLWAVYTHVLLYPYINTDSGSGVWAEITMHDGVGIDKARSAFWLGAGFPQHLDAVFIPPQGKASRRFIKDWCIAIFVRSPDVLVVWRTPPGWSGSSYSGSFGYRRFRLVGLTDRTVRDAYGLSYLKELLPPK